MQENARSDRHETQPARAHEQVCLHPLRHLLGARTRPVRTAELERRAFGFRHRISRREKLVRERHKLIGTLAWTCPSPRVQPARRRPLVDLTPYTPSIERGARNGRQSGDRIRYQRRVFTKLPHIGGRLQESRLGKCVVQWTGCVTHHAKRQLQQRIEVATRNHTDTHAVTDECHVRRHTLAAQPVRVGLPHEPRQNGQQPRRPGERWHDMLGLPGLVRRQLQHEPRRQRIECRHAILPGAYGVRINPLAARLDSRRHGSWNVIQGGIGTNEHAGQRAEVVERKWRSRKRPRDPLAQRDERSKRTPRNHGLEQIPDTGVIEGFDIARHGPPSR